MKLWQDLMKSRLNLFISIESGELLFIDIGAAGLSDIAGKYESDPTLQDICNEAYRQRDETILADCGYLHCSRSHFNFKKST